MTRNEIVEKNNSFIMYTTEDGKTKIDVKFDDDTVWLTQAQMAELFQTTPQNITMHIGNVYLEGELEEQSTCKDFLQVQQEGTRTVNRSKKFYNLDVIISVGYRVKSLRGTQFRIWANKTTATFCQLSNQFDNSSIRQSLQALPSTARAPFAKHNH